MKLTAEIVYNQMLDKLITQDNLQLFSALRASIVGNFTYTVKDYITRVNDSYSLLGMFISDDDTFDSGGGIYHIKPELVNSVPASHDSRGSLYHYEGFTHPTSQDRFVYVAEKSEALSKYGTWIQRCERNIINLLPHNFTNSDVVDLCINYSKDRSQFNVKITSKYINDYLLLR